MPPRLLATACLTLAVLDATGGQAAPDAAGRIADDLRAGRYEKVLRQMPRGGKSVARIAVLASRAERSLGHLAQARARLQEAIGRTPEVLPLRAELMRVLDALGDRPALRTLVDQSRRDWEAGRVARTNAADLVAIAVALRFDDDWDDANASLRAAVKAAPRDVEANLEWGQTFLAKHAAANAETSFRAVLAIDRANPDAHAGLARVLIDEKYDEVGAEAEIAAALAVNPRHATALGLRGEIALDAEEMEGAAAVVNELRRTDPTDATAAWLAAARALLLDDRDGYQREKQARLGTRPADGDFFASTAEALVRHRRYEDARAVAAEGVALDPTNARCLASLGLTLLRLGDEREGLTMVRRARERDPYDERNFNLLDLFEKVIPARYTIVETSHLSFRVEPRARAAIDAVVGPYLEEVYARYVKRYGFTPAGRVLFELYGSPDEYAIRTVGLPRLGVTAVCFGRVITSQAPTNAAFNWGLVLSHELAHVFALQLSRSRVPRWFTEGLAEVETAALRPEWQRHDELALSAAQASGSLPSLAELSQAFVRARDADAAALAYAHAAAAVGFLERRLGFPRIRQALVAFGRGERTTAVLESLSNGRLAALEKEFRGDLQRQLGTLGAQFLPSHQMRLERGGKSLSPADEAANGLDALRRGDLAAAHVALRQATARPSAASEPMVIFLSAELAAKDGHSGKAVAALETLLMNGHDGYDVRLRLALAAMTSDDRGAAEAHLRRAITLAPTEPEARMVLVELLGRTGRDDERRAQEAELLPLEPQNAALAKRVVLDYARRGNARAVIETAPSALFVDPADADIHAALGRALAADNRTRDARQALERALLFSPADIPGVRRALAEVLDRLGETTAAAKQRQMATREAVTAPPINGASKAPTSPRPTR